MVLNDTFVDINKQLLLIVGSILITCLVFLLMAYLITPRHQAPTEDVKTTEIKISRQEREKKNRTQTSTPVKPVIKSTPPPPVIARANTRPSNLEADISLPAADFVASNNGIGIINDRRAIPVVQIPPRYPQTQLNNQVEGWVLVEFTISKTGRVENPRIIDAEPKKVFDTATLRSIKRWKYQPKVVEGIAVQQDNMRELFRYQIEDKET